MSERLSVVSEMSETVREQQMRDDEGDEQEQEQEQREGEYEDQDTEMQAVDAERQGEQDWWERGR